MSDAKSAWAEYANRNHMHSRTNLPSKDFLAGFAAGEAESKPLVDLMRSLSINPEIPQGFRSIMKSALDQ